MRGVVAKKIRRDLERYEFRAGGLVAAVVFKIIYEDLRKNGGGGD